jgi:hypothetical protein
MPRDDDLRIRRYPRSLQISNDLESVQNTDCQWTWAALVAQTYNNVRAVCSQDDQALFLRYDSPGPRRFQAKDVFNIEKAKRGYFEPTGVLGEEFKDWAGGDAIVLIGGTFGASRDFYETPAGYLPGLIVNAYAVQSELKGRRIREISPLISFLMDSLVGWLIVFFFWRYAKMVSAINWTGILTAVLIGISFALPLFGYLWLGWIGMLVGALVHIVIEVYRADPSSRDER